MSKINGNKESRVHGEISTETVNKESMENINTGLFLTELVPIQSNIIQTASLL